MIRKQSFTALRLYLLWYQGTTRMRIAAAPLVHPMREMKSRSWENVGLAPIGGGRDACLAEPSDKALHTTNIHRGAPAATGTSQYARNPTEASVGCLACFRLSAQVVACAERIAGRMSRVCLAEEEADAAYHRQDVPWKD